MPENRKLAVAPWHADIRTLGLSKTIVVDAASFDVFMDKNAEKATCYCDRKARINYPKNHTTHRLYI